MKARINPLQRVAAELAAHPDVRWDRFIRYGGKLRAYGWLPRKDGRADFLLIDFDAAMGAWADWVTSAYPHPASVVERLETEQSVECQRVEDQFDIPNAVRLADQQQHPTEEGGPMAENKQLRGKLAELRDEVERLRGQVADQPEKGGGAAKLTVDEAREMVERAWHFSYRGLTLDDVEISDSPGYWEKKEPCGGRGCCSSPLHLCLFNDGPVRHTVTFTEHGRRDARGRFVSPYRVWRVLRDHRGGKG